MEEPMGLFSLSKTPKLNVKALPGGRYRALVADEDGTVMLDRQCATFAEAAEAVQAMNKHLARVRKEILGVESLVAMRDEYRKAKNRADQLRDVFAKAKNKMSQDEYRKARAHEV
jgi:hypothetical protein